MVVGFSSAAAGHRGFRWSEADGLTELAGLYSYSGNATAVSADGSVIVGSSSNLTVNEAWRWTTEDGVTGLGEAKTANCSPVDEDA